MGRDGPAITSILRVLEVDPPFPQIDIIGAMVIVWRVRGKIISLFCAILCATIVHSAMHTHMNRPNSSLDWVLSNWAHFTVLRFIFVCVLLCVHCMHVYCVVLSHGEVDLVGLKPILRTTTSFCALAQLVGSFDP